jgi:hypothetical protein
LIQLTIQLCKRLHLVGYLGNSINLEVNLKSGILYVKDSLGNSTKVFVGEDSLNNDTLLHHLSKAINIDFVS